MAHLLELTSPQLRGIRLRTLANIIHVGLLSRVVAVHVRCVAIGYLMVALEGTLVVGICLHVVSVTGARHTSRCIHRILSRFGGGQRLILILILRLPSKLRCRHCVQLVF